MVRRARRSDELEIMLNRSVICNASPSKMAMYLEAGKNIITLKEVENIIIIHKSGADDECENNMLWWLMVVEVQLWEKEIGTMSSYTLEDVDIRLFEGKCSSPPPREPQQSSSVTHWQM